MKKIRRYLTTFAVCLLLAAVCLLIENRITTKEYSAIEVAAGANGDYIKWVDFNVSYEALCAAYELDVQSYDAPVHLNWIELLAYAAARQGGEFGKEALKNIDECASELREGESMEKLTEKLKYYPYYLEAYTAVLGGFVGEYEAEGEKRYGLKAFSPIAKDFPYTDYDDFGASRSYGYARPHLGHDMMGQIGTPNSIKNYIEIQPCYNS